LDILVAVQAGNAMLDPSKPVAKMIQGAGSKFEARLFSSAAMPQR
jgi:hypothetical protein